MFRRARGQAEVPSHELPSFAAYLAKVFHFREALSSLRDAPQNPDIPPQAVFRALLYGFVFRTRSFQQQTRLGGAPRSVGPGPRYAIQIIHCGF